jgi:hypothetical protein
MERLSSTTATAKLTLPPLTPRLVAPARKRCSSSH